MEVRLADCRWNRSERSPSETEADDTGHSARRGLHNHLPVIIRRNTWYPVIHEVGDRCPGLQSPVGRADVRATGVVRRDRIRIHLVRIVRNGKTDARTFAVSGEDLRARHGGGRKYGGFGKL